MKTLITTLNSKYIHTSLSLRLLYVASYKNHDVSMKEYTIKDKMSAIADDILSQGYDIVAFSCYIWNIEYIKELSALLKQKNPSMIIIYGGPEVTYDAKYFIDHYDVDYVISGEGEEVFPKLIEAIENNSVVELDGVSYKGCISNEIASVDLQYVESLDSPYQLDFDKPHLSKRILYFESSRGCPFQCQYCLSSLEKGLRYFSEDYLVRQLDYICHSDVKTIKFLDRSFNSNVKHAIMILDYIFNNYKEGQQYQFEINADVLQQPIIDFIKENAPKNLIRFEVGIQSTYEPTNISVKRRQNFARLSEVVTQLMEDGKVDLHLDLIAGLPYESYDRFKKSFDDVFAFRAKELQLGFLKMLRGTSLRNNADEWGYTYDEASPYEMIQNDVLSKEDVKNIHIAEDMLEKYWNSGRFNKTLNAIMDYEESPFEFFYKLGCFYHENNYKTIGFQLDELFKYLDTYLYEKYDEVIYAKLHELLIYDYLSLFKVKPKKWYESTIESSKRKETIRRLSETYHLDSELLFRYGVVERFSEGYLVVIYKDFRCDMQFYKGEELC